MCIIACCLLCYPALPDSLEFCLRQNSTWRNSRGKLYYFSHHLLKHGEILQKTSILVNKAFFRQDYRVKHTFIFIIFKRHLILPTAYSSSTYFLPFLRLQSLQSI